MENAEIAGSCLCGQVTYQYTGPVKVFQYCHCTRCQKFTGAAHAANVIVDPTHFEWLKGEDLLGRFELPGAKHFATGFCKKCGSSMPWLTQTGKAVVIPAGTLDDDPKIKPRHNIYLTNRAPWYDGVDSILGYEELPVG